MRYIITAKAVFPEGISSKQSGIDQTDALCRDGRGYIVLRGTSLAGFLRSEFSRFVSAKAAKNWFGSAADADALAGYQSSRIQVENIVLAKPETQSAIRTHNAVDRKTGSVTDSALFQVETAPAGVQGSLVLHIDACSAEVEQADVKDEVQKVLGTLVKILESGPTLGGNRNRGIGRLQVEDLKVMQYDISKKNEYATWIDDRIAINRGNNPQTGKPWTPSVFFESKYTSESIKVEWLLPAGQDILVATGQEGEFTGIPSSEFHNNGDECWILPGSTFRGVFRSWILRLLKIRERDNKLVEGSESPEDLVDALFGTLEGRGRIHFSNAYSPQKAKDSDTQERTHVAIDAFSGGAIDSALFKNKVLCGPMQFSMTISLQNATELERELLRLTMKAVHEGVLSLGSSKASGWLQVESTSLKDWEVSHGS